MNIWFRILANAVFMSGGSQNFIGARWVPTALRVTPAPLKRWAALRLLAMSPHYFYGSVATEAERNRRSRKRITDDVLAPLLFPGATVLDYGCGPGYLASSVSAHVKAVDAVDVSGGAIACAKVLNSAPNIRYMTVEEFRRADSAYDLVYSFAVIQHLTDAVFKDILEDMYTRLKTGGRIALHVVIDAPGWRTETEWKSDHSVRGRIKLIHGLNCFTRSAAAITGLISGAGFQDVTVENMTTLTSVTDDIARQNLVLAVKR